ncbi:MAG TPA: hypothetical protein VFT36_05470 [Methylomirabilota bacterium]|nr:hypothetical protein [Methylomirabilota bacterium]
MTVALAERLLEGRLGRPPASPPRVVLEHDGQIVSTHTAAEALGNPLVSLARAANRPGRMGRGLRATDVVLTGSSSKVRRPTPGQSVRASFTRLGSAACRFV